MKNILVVDTDRNICSVLSTFLGKNNYSVTTSHSSEDCIQLARANDYNLILIDYQLPGQSGSELIQKLKIFNPLAALVITTIHPDLRDAVEAFRFGAVDYISKPLYPDELLVTLKNAIAKSSGTDTVPTSNGNSKRSNHENGHVPHGFVIGKSPQSLAVQRHIELIAPSDMSVIINGETGTGKEFVAQSIHRLSKRASEVFVAIDCGSLPKELTGSELFGHVKGAFTGAINDKQGSFELANGGTIFLDEIGNLSYDNQIKLLRVIQERKIKRIGATKDITIDVRIITATNENLLIAVKDGKVREDLYHRLNEFKIQLAPLRERREDITFFANYFLAKANSELEKVVSAFSADVWSLFYSYAWNGNLRELNNVIRRSVLLSEGDTIEMESLPTEMVQSQGSQQMNESAHGQVGLLKSIAWTAERQAIVDTLERVNNNKSRASELLTIDRKTLYNKLKLYNIKA